MSNYREQSEAEARLSSRLRIVRAGSNLSQAAIANRCGCSQQRYSYWENTGRLKGTELIRLAKAYGKSLSDFE